MTATRGNWLTPMAIIVCSLAAGAIYTWVAGEDVNWDWQNYHEYNVWAVLNGRYASDVVPAGFQTYFNPLIYFPIYYLRHAVPAPYGFLVMGAIHGLNLALIYLFSRIVLKDAASAFTLAAAVLIAAFGPMTLSETGTSFSDILLALPIIAGFGLILSAVESHRASYVLAGLLLGAAVGLKLTNVVFALGAAAAVLVSARPFAATVCLALGGAIGAVATGGAWSFMLWQELGNPIFPLFNGVFNSKEVQPSNILDLQFMPRTMLDALAYPFYWLVGDHRSSEFPFRDARFAVVMILIPVCIAARIIRRIAIFTRRDVMFFVMFGVSYAAWLGLFSIQRYAIVLELLCGPLIVLMLARAFSANSSIVEDARSSYARTGAVTFSVAAAIAMWSQPGDWWRRPWSDPYRPAISDRLKQPATYFLLDKPIAYIVPLLPPHSRFYQIADIALPIVADGKFDRRIRAGLADPLPGGLWELHLREQPLKQELLEKYGLRIDGSQACVDIESASHRINVVACPLKNDSD